MDYPLRNEAVLRQSLVVDYDGQEQSKQLTLEIQAPTALPGGYNLRVQHQGSKISVKIPDGGVEANQVFRVNVPKPETTTPPVGHWKDGFIEIFRYGALHPHALTSLACSLCSSAESARAFDIIFYITLFHWFMIISMFLALAAFDDTDYTLPVNERDPPTGLLLVVIIFFDFFKYAYFILNVYILFRLRLSIRKQSGIPGDASQDFCQTLWCPCLAAAQLLRHTTSYDRVPARFCTRTGLMEEDEDDLI